VRAQTACLRRSVECRRRKKSLSGVVRHHLLDKGQDEGEGRQAQARRQQREYLCWQGPWVSESVTSSTDATCICCCSQGFVRQMQVALLWASMMHLLGWGIAGCRKVLSEDPQADL